MVMRRCGSAIGGIVQQRRCGSVPSKITPRARCALGIRRSEAESAHDSVGGSSTLGLSFCVDFAAFEHDFRAVRA